MNDDLMVAIVAIAAAVVILGIAWFTLSRRRTGQLKEHYGNEYEYLTSVEGRRAAERDLKDREKRVKTYEIKELHPEQRAAFAADWIGIQTKFVDDPQSAIVDADVLVQKVMHNRGYPLSDFEKQAADISVDHPDVVRNYRLGHAISGSARHGRASTEELRQGMLHYRALFEELLGQTAAAGTR